MAKSEEKSDEDLTIEEILSSIRKIISEDEEAACDGEAEHAAEIGLPEEDVLDLTDVVDDKDKTDFDSFELSGEGELTPEPGPEIEIVNIEESPPKEYRQTLEGFVSAMLKPMLKEWLDLNLPNIVQRSVEAEIARITRYKK